MNALFLPCRLRGSGGSLIHLGLHVHCDYGDKLMNFTREIKARWFVGVILASAVLGLILWTSHGPTKPMTSGVDESVQANTHIAKTPGFQTAGPYYYQPVASWSKTKHWLKRNAPIIGGAGGGAVVGGLVGGGTGALVGGGLGAGGGYLYKRHHEHHYHEHHSHAHYSHENYQQHK